MANFTIRIPMGLRVAPGPPRAHTRCVGQMGGPVSGLGRSMQSFGELQQQLGPALMANKPGSGIDHVLVVLPSFSLGESTLSHYAARIPALEHRYLLALFQLGRIESCEMIFISTMAPEPEVLDYYFSLIPPERRESAQARFSVVSLPDHSARAVADKLIDRPELLEMIKARFGGRPAFIEPWNVTRSEAEIAVRLGAPINGTAPDLWTLGFKSSGRRIFREAQVMLPFGFEDVRSPDDIASAIHAIRKARPKATGVVVKHDNSGSGDGNRLIRFAGLPEPNDEGIRAHLAAWPEWYLRDLAQGGVVEELIHGDRFSSPSAQVDIAPDGTVAVLATHEQDLGGDEGQVYQGCRFPADPAYAAQLAETARAVGARLAALGVIGRFSIDFAAAWDGPDSVRTFALEVNLRKGGTTHPYAALRNLVPGYYDPGEGSWRAAAGGTRAYRSTDNLFDAAWKGLPPIKVIEAVRDGALEFDPSAGTGVVLHMLSCLAIDGRFGLTAIGRSPSHASELFEAVRPSINRAISA
ncbi:MAG TPA: peptide ligase PGM1-related protein [Bauldia sp.]|nr:peptide ligase PGM1-related protein [Bauldia sp.]